MRKTSVLGCMKIAELSCFNKLTVALWHLSMHELLAMPIGSCSVMHAGRVLTYRTSAMGGGSALSGASVKGQPTAFNFCNTNPASASPHGH
jgi:hypothetical protein